MASVLHHLYSLFSLVTLFSLLSSNCSCFNISEEDAVGFQSTVATFYGPKNGAGDGGGDCGYGVPILQNRPFSKFIAAGGTSLFNNGKGCGICYEVKCTSNPACLGKPIRVTLADFCPPTCGAFQFDLSGTAYGALAFPGRSEELYKAGRLQVLYQRVQCNYPGFTITSKIDPGSNPFFFSTAIVYENGDGDLAKVEIQLGSGPFFPMQQLFGATWKFNSAQRQPGPFSLRISSSSGKSVVANNVIPKGWQPGQIFPSNVNFPG